MFGDPFWERDSDHQIFCTLDYHKVAVRPSADNCWWDFFPRAVIAEGYPVLSQRYAEDTGLEIRLDMIEATIGKQRIVALADNVSILASDVGLLVPVRTAESPAVIQWHYMADTRHNLVSYKMAWQLARQRPIDLEIDRDILKHVRHIVAWTDAAVMNLGKSTQRKTWLVCHD